MKRHLFIFVIFLISIISSYGQGINNLWLLGYNDTIDQYTTAAKAIIDFSGGFPNVAPQTRKMPFEETEGNISNSNGNFLMSSNGIWIADATGDTMLNGSGLNPGFFADNYSTLGAPMAFANVFLPYPGDSNKYVLFHMIGNYSINGTVASELYYSVIDMSFNGGLGKVIAKNQIAINDTLGWGITACRHANGRDWWIIVLKDSSNIIYKVLFTPNGVQSVTTQSDFWLPVNPYGNVCVGTFSPNGKKFAYQGWTYSSNYHMNVRLFDFDRCTGILSNYTYIPTDDNRPGFGLSFSPNSKYLYYSSTYHIYQINTDTSNVVASLDTVATNDGYYSPVPPFQTDFELMYLASDGKIYLSTANGTNALHYMNYPDSGGIACDVHEHGIILPCYNVGTVPNHPNYFLGCDTTGGCTCLTTNIENLSQHNFNFSVYPNPVSNQQIKITYLLPQNKKGVFEIFDVTGRKVFSYSLPQWSTMQYFSLPDLSSGIYNCVITSDSERTSKKIAVVKE